MRCSCRIPGLHAALSMFDAGVWSRRRPLLHALYLLLPALIGLLWSGAALGHDVAERDVRFLESVTGPEVAAFLYLGAKHMVTGYDHLLYLAGVIFFLYRLRDVALYVTLFAVGHSVTLLTGVLAGVNANPDAIDAIIGLSVVYKAFENIGGFQRLGIRIDGRAAVLAFGLAHGFGLATMMQEVELAAHGLVTNIISFNIGVELGQFAALAVLLVVLQLWRASGGFLRTAYAANLFIMTAGFVLFGYHATGFLFV